MIQLNAVLLMLPQGQAGGGTNWSFMLLMIAFIVVFYFFLMRPQQKKAKDQKNFINNLQKGDKVVTIAGVHGTVNKVNEDGSTIMLETSPGSYVKLEKSAISLEWTDALRKANAGASTK